MTTSEAYDETISAVEELRESGICTYLKPARSRNDLACVAKYSSPERVVPEKWLHVTFHPRTDEHRRLIVEKARHLSWLGIKFDTGGSVGQRDWELDWSFRCTGCPDGEFEELQDELENLITASE